MYHDFVFISSNTAVGTSCFNLISVASAGVWPWRRNLKRLLWSYLLRWTGTRYIEQQYLTQCRMANSKINNNYWHESPSLISPLKTLPSYITFNQPYWNSYYYVFECLILWSVEMCWKSCHACQVLSLAVDFSPVSQRIICWEPCTLFTPLNDSTELSLKYSPKSISISLCSSDAVICLLTRLAVYQWPCRVLANKKVLFWFGFNFAFWITDIWEKRKKKYISVAYTMNSSIFQCKRKLCKFWILVCRPIYSDAML